MTLYDETTTNDLALNGKWKIPSYEERHDIKICATCRHFGLLYCYRYGTLVEALGLCGSHEKLSIEARAAATAIAKANLSAK